jgi:hypothetical protein
MRVLAHIGAQRSAAKFDDGARQRPMPDGAAAETAELAERAVDDGESVTRGVQRLGRKPQQLRPPAATLFSARYFSFIT